MFKRSRPGPPRPLWAPNSPLAVSHGWDARRRRTSLLRRRAASSTASRRRRCRRAGWPGRACAPPLGACGVPAPDDAAARSARSGSRRRPRTSARSTLRPRGLRLLAPVPHGHWKTTTLVAGLRTTGMTAPYVLDGAVNGDIFRAYVEQILAPTLGPGDIVVMDNLPCHKVAGIQEAIESRQARLLYLPPYSPDLNPIEQAFAKLKALLRKVGERTRDGLWNAIGHILKLYSPDECRNLFRNSGYST